MTIGRAISFAGCVALAGALQAPLREQRAPDELPTVAEILQNPMASLEIVGSHISSFAGMLTRKSADHKKLIEEQKANYEHILFQQVGENDALKRVNHRIKMEIASLDENYTQLRSEATSLQLRASHLTHRLETMRTNITLATEYASEALSKADSFLWGEYVQVLKDLDAKDAIKEREEEHERHLRQLGSGDEIAMVQTGSFEGPLHKTATQQLLLSKLASSMEDLQRKQRKTEDALKETFDRELRKMTAYRDELLEEREELTSQRMEKQKLCDALVVAVVHLKKGNAKLYSEENALKLFSEHLSGRSTPFLEAPRWTPLEPVFAGHD